MAILHEELNLFEIFKDIGSICQSVEHCNGCAESNCLIGYAREVTATCRKEKRAGVVDGMKNIPDEISMKELESYDETKVLHAIAHLLVQCKSCKETHYDNCLINVVRSCYEIIVFGDTKEFEGNVLPYLLEIAQRYPEKAKIIKEEYMAHKERMLI